jgi:hypothetical protein
VREDKARVGLPGVDGVAALLADLGNVVAVVDDKGQTEALLHLGLPLADDGGRDADDDAADLLAHQQLTHDEARFDGLAQAHVVGNKQVYARHAQGHAQGLQLVGLDLDTGAVGRLKQLGIGGGDAAPAQGMQEGREQARLVKAPAGDAVPVGLTQQTGVDLALPQDL